MWPQGLGATVAGLEVVSGVNEWVELGARPEGRVNGGDVRLRFDGHRGKRHAKFGRHPRPDAVESVG